MNQLSLQNVLVATMLLSFCSCASPSKDKRRADGRASAGVQIQKGAVNGLRYLVGVPFFLGVAILGPFGGVSPAYGLEGLQELHDYEVPDGSTKANEETRLVLPPK
jgi:hypothetical protein